MLPLGTFTRLLNQVPRFVQTTILSLLCNLKMTFNKDEEKNRGNNSTENERQLENFRLYLLCAIRDKYARKLNSPHKDSRKCMKNIRRILILSQT